MTHHIKELQVLSPSPPSSSSSRPPSFLSLSLCLQEAMRPTLPALLFFAFASLFLFAFFSLHLSRTTQLIQHFPIAIDNININYAIFHNDNHNPQLPATHRALHVSSIIINHSAISTVSILFPDWELLVVVSPHTPISAANDTYVCLFQNNDTSPVRFSKTLPFSNRTTLTCPMPKSVKHLRPFYQPVLERSEEKDARAPGPGSPELIRWNFLVYESISTENDVVVFVKGLNHRQGVNRPPSEFRCVFGDSDKNSLKTAVTSSTQEVFRCQHPNLMELEDTIYYNEQQQQQQQERRRQDVTKFKISLEIVDGHVVLPSVAYYTRPRPRTRLTTTQTTSSKPDPDHDVCACTMVYNVAKFLREWVIYHSKIGVDYFILYDNDSDDNLESVVLGLQQEGYNITTLFWVWPKTQEAGFSHSAIYAKHLCKWVLYIDVDEFVFAPYSWAHSVQPSKHMIKSLLPEHNNRENNNKYVAVGQVSINCNDFGPSNRKTHPAEGVTQGYTCRRRFEQRHKSMVLLDAVDYSLLNMIHHFEMKKGYRSRKLSMEEGVVNHYKYQAWPEFRTKFRRRVSAYVVDWTQALNPKSKDRTPGLGFEPVEPKGWADMFCEVRDERLKMLTQRWFGSPTSNNDGYRMLWQT
ncbi:unnamed protein product [Prunus armeniaca]|uniref:Glycosyltransferase family 92 protein n=1 Tax=Prunus armeniaca TaxID=36596 RepID=A0A6J5UU78_PRUAR|nr:unnamed protein product [Prunus armeniaca]